MNVEIETRGRLVLVQRDLGPFSVRGAAALGGSGDALVWDTLASPGDMSALGAHLAARAVTVVYSHADWDHCWGTAGLDGHPCRAIVAHRAAATRFTDELPATLDQMRSSQPGQWDDVRLDAPNLLVEKGLTLDVGGLTVQLESVPGHSDDSLIGWLPELGVLLAGDAAEDPLPEVRAPADIAAWADALERWSSESGLRVVVPGHGAVSGPKLLNRNARYLRALAEPASRPTGALDDARSAHPVETMLGGALSGYYHQLHSANVAAVADWRRNGGPTRTGV